MTTTAQFGPSAVPRSAGRRTPHLYLDQSGSPAPRSGAGRPRGPHGAGPGLLAALTAEQLDGEVDSPNGGSATVRQCLKVVFNEEGWHDHHARRDLAVLARRAEQPS